MDNTGKKFRVTYDYGSSDSQKRYCCGWFAEGKGRAGRFPLLCQTGRPELTVLRLLQRDPPHSPALPGRTTAATRPRSNRGCAKAEWGKYPNVHDQSGSIFRQKKPNLGLKADIALAIVEK